MTTPHGEQCGVLGLVASPGKMKLSSDLVPVKDEL